MGNQQTSLPETEVFRQHQLYPVLSISQYGNIVNSKTGKPRYTTTNKQGYLVTQIVEVGKRKTLKVHRLVAEMFLPEPDEELLLKCSKEHHGKVLVKHLDNNKLNNYYTNLMYSDLLGNTVQAWDDGLIFGLKGSLNGRATLSEDLVHAICKDYQEGMKPKAAVAKYNISTQQATKIKAGIQWKHIWCQYDIKVNRREKVPTTIETAEQSETE
jgi:hypothetical protein